jgi:hypothetical protein
MTVITRSPENTNNLQPTKFLLTFDRIKTVQYFCQSANIPGMTLGQATINTPMLDVYSPSTKMSYNHFTVQFTVDEKLKSWQELHSWFRSIASPVGFNERNRLTALQNQFATKKSVYSDGIFTTLSALNNPIVSIQFFNLFPISLSDIDFDTKLSADTIITASATFVYDYFDFIDT